MVSVEASPSQMSAGGDAGDARVTDFNAALNSTWAERFQAMLPRIVERMVGPGEAAQQALDHGGFLLNESTVVMRHNPETDSVEFFCDVGMPMAHSREASYRTALELNLCRTYPGVVFGVHPESGRMVATTATHAMLVADDEVCIETLQMLTQVVRQLRDSREFDVEV